MKKGRNVAENQTANKYGIARGNIRKSFNNQGCFAMEKGCADMQHR
jgi:hypothetical protein